MTWPAAAYPLKVLVAGGGVAGLEVLLALRHLAGDRVERTLLTPEDEFVYRPMAVAEPFARGHAQRHRLDAIAQDLGARLVRGSLADVDDRTRTATTSAGERLSYDALVVAIGARSELALERASTWTPESDGEIYRRSAARCRGGLHQAPRVRDPARRRLAAARLRARPDDCLGRARHGHQRRPDHDLHAGGRAAGAVRRRRRQALREDLDELGIQVVTSAYVADAPDGQLVVEPGARRLEADRVVALPRAAGPALPGVLNDAHGFIRCDRTARSTTPPPCGRRATRSRSPSSRAGWPRSRPTRSPRRSPRAPAPTCDPQPFRPVLRGVLLTGRGQAWMRNVVAGGDGEGEAQRRALFWPPTKIAGRYLSPYLAALDHAQAIGEIPQPSGHPVELDLERERPGATATGSSGT